LVADAIRRIKEAEGEAEETLRRARAQGKRLTAEAHEASEKLVDEMRRAVRDEERELIASASAEAETEAARIAAESKASVESVRADAEARVRRGVGRVLEAIVSGA
jgi:vacuolar-type H+-ATPase subunit H